MRLLLQQHVPLPSQANLKVLSELKRGLGTWDDVLLVQGIDEGCAVLAALVQRLLEQDSARNVLAKAWRC